MLVEPVTDGPSRRNHLQRLLIVGLTNNCQTAVIRQVEPLKSDRGESQRFDTINVVIVVFEVVVLVRILVDAGDA